MSKQPIATRVLFVCMGNICRSPTAEAVFRSLAEEAGLGSSIVVDSAGTHAYHEGHGADARSVAAAAARGYDLGGHRARRVRDDDFAEFDYLIAMDDENIAELKRRCPAGFEFRLSTMMSYADSGVSEVPDPYYGASGFEDVLDMVEDASRGLLDYIQRMQQGTTLA